MPGIGSVQPVKDELLAEHDELKQQLKQVQPVKDELLAEYDELKQQLKQQKDKLAGQTGQHGSNVPQPYTFLHTMKQGHHNQNRYDCDVLPDRRAPQQTTIEQEMEKIFATAEPMLKISTRIMEMKAAEEGVGEKLGRATARYCDRMMEYFEDEGFTREESMQLLCSIIRNNSILTG